MLTNKYLLIGLSFLVLLVLYFSFFDGNPSGSSEGLNASVQPKEYNRQLQQERKKKDQLFKNGADSPITDKANFKGLSYFPSDPNFRVIAKLEPFADKTQKLVVRMSDGSEEVYDKFAHAVFSLNGETCRLLIVRVQKTYSILFRDVTSGTETYGGGRYLELAPAQLTDSQALLDFNSAYNPYCAYNPTFACPLPPAENKLPIAVKAGERYH
ncbi:DUF1684 domain-containing protein [Spirosoma endbachense]|uniref:DUF1684 domain-containing protein n=1 Tax=Spirosoma endbachense TaxID=2666025 RepID=A0A6P1VW87_9BACT|nr:DUF1684 domain-containing protein [Spirosoma endbachense]QHV95939.1 DUF1684 domain-containing protein [Spirosoma endbachense]